MQDQGDVERGIHKVSEYVYSEGFVNDPPTFVMERGERVTRCRDCRYFKEFEALKVDGYKCTRVPTPFETFPDHFCSCAELKE